MASATFNAGRHMACQEPPRVHSMESLGLPRNSGISDMAVSHPFQLFTEEAVRKMRHEALAPAVLDNHSFSSNINPLQLRGYVPSRAPFIEQAWKHPELLALLSRVAGIDLIPVCDYEIGHINLSTPSTNTNVNPAHHTAPGASRPVVDWHYDAYPFVCVVMLSDSRHTAGGETLVRTSHRYAHLPARLARAGEALVLQGRYVEHMALPAAGGAERVAMVTSFRPKSPFVPINERLATVRPVSDLRQLYYQFAEYRLEVLQKRVERELEKLRAKGPLGFETRRAKQGLRGLWSMLARTDAELVEDVEMGRIT